MSETLTYVSTKCAKFSLIEDGVLHIEILADTEIDLTESKAMQQKSLEITKGKKFVALIDARATTLVTKESREWGSTAEAQVNMLAQAIIINSLASRLIGNFIIKFHKPIAKTRLFPEEESALFWLREQKKILKI
jgi:hypothetical protein